MNVFTQSLYKEFENEFLTNIKLKKNFIILTVPGLGITHFTKVFVKKKSDLKLSYINSQDQDLSDYNILDLNFDKNEDALRVVDKYFKNANIHQKFAIIVNTPHIVHSKKYEKSYFSSRIYQTYYFQVRNQKDTKSFAREVNNSLNKDQLDQICKLSGGIGKIIKFMSLNPEKLLLDEDKLGKDKDLVKAISSLIDVLKECDDLVLTRIGIKQDQDFVSTILTEYFNNNPIKAKFNINVLNDLSFSENFHKSAVKLTKEESQIISVLLDQGMITREKIADIKWGEGSYDQYSDQAINKTVQRLNKKLKEHRLSSIPKTGYFIEIQDVRR